MLGIGMEYGVSSADLGCRGVGWVCLIRQTDVVRTDEYEHGDLTVLRIMRIMMSERAGGTGLYQVFVCS